MHPPVPEKIPQSELELRFGKAVLRSKDLSESTKSSLSNGPTTGATKRKSDANQSGPPSKQQGGPRSAPATFTSKGEYWFIAGVMCRTRVSIPPLGMTSSLDAPRRSQGAREAFSSAFVHYSHHLISRFVTRRSQGAREALTSAFVHNTLLPSPDSSRFVRV